MEQIFSLIVDIVDKARSFKTDCGLTNFCYNLFTYFNKRYFSTGKWKGFLSLMRARSQYEQVKIKWKLSVLICNSTAVSIEYF